MLPSELMDGGMAQRIQRRGLGDARGHGGGWGHRDQPSGAYWLLSALLVGG